MKKHTTLVQALCAPYCIYFKHNRNEELLCRGAVIVDRLIADRMFLPGSESEPEAPVPGAQEILIRRVCAVCDFQPNDCDFSQDRSAQPCGGFLLLRRLLEAGVISEEVL
jgi:hypothetical protein